LAYNINNIDYPEIFVMIPPLLPLFCCCYIRLNYY